MAEDSQPTPLEVRPFSARDVFRVLRILGKTFVDRAQLREVVEATIDLFQRRTADDSASDSLSREDMLDGGLVAWDIVDRIATHAEAEMLEWLASMLEPPMTPKDFGDAPADLLFDTIMAVARQEGAADFFAAVARRSRAQSEQSPSAASRTPDPD